ncbi:MAG TPA: DUF6644 family protein [Candidatus Acidoferrum sp.]|nr:DUF6644 family protein [Candidatus Acidoferrum sp.]
MQENFFEWLKNTPPAVLVGESWFPYVESTHVLFMAVVIGSILTVDARLLGMGLPNLRITYISQRLLPMTWIAFVGAAITGGLMFMSDATNYIHNPPFIAKMVVLVVLGLNMAYFHFVTYRNVAQWDTGAPSAGARTAGFISTVLWIAVIALGRWIGFVSNVH